MTTANAISNTVARIFGRPTDLEVRLKKAIRQAHVNTTRRYAVDDASLFDHQFLFEAGTPIIDNFLSGKQSRQSATVALAQAWNVDLGPISSRQRKWRMADTAMIADTFLVELGKALDT